MRWRETESKTGKRRGFAANSLVGIQSLLGGGSVMGCARETDGRVP